MTTPIEVRDAFELFHKSKYTGYSYRRIGLGYFDIRTDLDFCTFLAGVAYSESIKTSLQLNNNNVLGGQTSVLDK
jgi:hypothetical protein